MNFKLIFFFVIFHGLIFSQSKTKRVYSDDNFIYEFEISLDKVKLKKGRKFYWYNYDKIKQTSYGVNGKVLNGRYIKTLLVSDKLVEKGVFLHGLKNGEWKNWLENGNISRIQFWKDGYKHGIYKQYNKSSDLVEEGYYKHDMKDGTWINYSNEGKIVKNWTKNVLNGKYINYDKKFDVLEKGFYKGNKKHGRWIKYSGKKNKVIKTWKKNVLNGVFEEYKADTLIRFGSYKVGLKHGLWIDFKEKTRYKYKEGKLIDKNAKTIWKRIFTGSKKVKNKI